MLYERKLHHHGSAGHRRCYPVGLGSRQPQVDVLHLLDSLLRQQSGVVPGLIQAAGGDSQRVGAEVRQALVALPSASGSTASQPDASRQLSVALAQAEKEMQAMRDEYVSTEHLLIAIAQGPRRPPIF